MASPIHAPKTCLLGPDPPGFFFFSKTPHMCGTHSMQWGARRGTRGCAMTHQSPSGIPRHMPQANLRNSPNASAVPSRLRKCKTKFALGRRLWRGVRSVWGCHRLLRHPPMTADADAALWQAMNVKTVAWVPWGSELPHGRLERGGGGSGCSGS